MHSGFVDRILGREFVRDLALIFDFPRLEEMSWEFEMLLRVATLKAVGQLISVSEAVWDKPGPPFEEKVQIS
jgi:hypothetical protein